MFELFAQCPEKLKQLKIEPQCAMAGNTNATRIHQLTTFIPQSFKFFLNPELNVLVLTYIPTHMPSQRRSIRKTSSTFVANVRSFAAVNKSMYSQFVSSSEALRADRTGVTAFTRV